MQLQQIHIDALTKAEEMIVHRDFCPYLELKELLPDVTPQARSRFRSLFTTYYGLNVGGLTDPFKDRFFEILFGGNIFVNELPDFQTILRELSLIPRRKGDCAMPFSFVSKLVAIQLETSPIYDRHVLDFFRLTAPESRKSKSEKIAWYIRTLNCVRIDYTEWAQDQRMVPIIQRLIGRDARLAQCNVVRLLDFLVWKVGNKNLL